MTKKKAKKKAGKKPAKRRSTPRKRKEPNLEEVRKEVTQLVQEHAAKMAEAAIGRGETGELPTVKYLFEMSGVFPKPAESTEGSAREDSLAETLLHRLNIPLEPFNPDSDNEPVELGAPAVVDEGEDEGEAGQSPAAAESANAEASEAPDSEKS